MAVDEVAVADADDAVEDADEAASGDGDRRSSSRRCRTLTDGSSTLIASSLALSPRGRHHIGEQRGDHGLPKRFTPFRGFGRRSGRLSSPPFFVSRWAAEAAEDRADGSLPSLRLVRGPTGGALLVRRPAARGWRRCASRSPGPVSLARGRLQLGLSLREAA